MKFPRHKSSCGIVIAVVVGLLGEMLAHRRASDRLVGAILFSFLAIFLVVGIFRFQIAGEPFLGGVPIISSIMAAAVLAAIWSTFAYRHVQPYTSRSFRHGSPIRRPQRNWFSRS